MPHQPKIATCCYCGTRAALVLIGKERHELACSNCGAPLHDLKMLRSDKTGERELVDPSPLRDYPPRPKLSESKYKKNKKKRKKRRSLGQRFMNELKDAAEDLFDDVFDIFD